MIHPFLHLIATRPHLLFEHAEAYSELAAAELKVVSNGWKRTAVLGAIAAAMLCLGVVFAGIALMLWAVVPLAQMQVPWLLLAVPLVPLVVGLACLVAMSRDSRAAPFDNLRRQLRADMDLLRETDLP